MAERARQTVLHVDDDDGVRRAVARALESAGFKVESIADGVEALASARRLAPDLVILDVDLPGLSGFDVCVRLRADRKTRAIPILHLSGARVDLPDRVQGLENGADAYLVQPVARDELVAVVRALVARGARAQRLHRERRRADQGAAAREVGLRTALHLLTRPLSAIGINASGLASSLGHDPVARARARTLVEAHATMTRLAADLLELAHLESSRGPLVLEAPTAGELLTGARRRTEDAADRVVVAGAPASVVIRCEVGRVEQALRTLLRLALRISGPGGAVRIGATVEGSEVRFSVDWEGPVAGPEERAVLGGSFWSRGRPRNAPDTLELAVACAVADAHGGRLWLDPELPAAHLSLPVLPLVS